METVVGVAKGMVEIAELCTVARDMSLDGRRIYGKEEERYPDKHPTRKERECQAHDAKDKESRRNGLSEFWALSYGIHMLLLRQIPRFGYKPGQFAAGVYPFASASSFVSNLMRFSSAIRLAPEHQGKWYLVPFFEPTYPGSWSSI